MEPLRHFGLFSYVFNPNQHAHKPGKQSSASERPIEFPSNRTLPARATRAGFGSSLLVARAPMDAKRKQSRWDVCKHVLTSSSSGARVVSPPPPCSFVLRPASAPENQIDSLLIIIWFERKGEGSGGRDWPFMARGALTYGARGGASGLKWA